MSVLKIKNGQGNWISIPTIKGDKGDSGDTPVVTASKSNGATTLSVDGTVIATIYDGEDATLDASADEYSSSATYDVGDYCAYNGNLYKCTTAISTGEEWNSGHWTQITLCDEISNLVKDIQINGNSIVNNGIASMPIVTNAQLGVCQAGDGLTSASGVVSIDFATADQVKAATSQRKTITPYQQHRAAFYGLAKAAGDSTQSASSNNVGTYTNDAKSAIKTMLGVTDPTVTDVQVNGTSVVTNGVANVPLGSLSEWGVFRLGQGLVVTSNNLLYTDRAVAADIKAATNEYRPITPLRQHMSAFYGLAKAAGDTTQASSSNEVGVYTDSAKTAIQDMLSVGGVIIEIPSQYNISFVEDTLPVASASYITGSTSYLLCTGEMKIYSLYILTDLETDDSAYNWDLEYTLVASPDEGKDYYIEIDGEYNHFRYVGSKFEHIGGTSLDVQINGTSIVSNGVANVPIAGNNTIGVMKIAQYGGLLVGSANDLKTNPATSSQIKAGTNTNNPLVPICQHESTFYGLAKAAGDSTQSASSNAVGTYTSDAKSAIKTMLGIVDTQDMVSDAYDATSTYDVGDYVIYNNSLYVCNTAIATAEAWTAAHWTQTTIGEELASIVNRIIDLENSVSGSLPDAESEAF